MGGVWIFSRTAQSLIEGLTGKEHAVSYDLASESKLHHSNTRMPQLWHTDLPSCQKQSSPFINGNGNSIYILHFLFTYSNVVNITSVQG